jgi:hypothetical protein
MSVRFVSTVLLCSLLLPAQAPPIAEPDAAPTAGTSRYAISIVLGERKMNMEIVSTLAEEDGGWMARDIMKTGGGEVVEEALLAKCSLTVLKRGAKQGATTIALEFAGNKASGSITTKGVSRPVTADLPGPLFADGAGSAQVFGLLPLSEGYKATFYNFDVVKATPRQMQVEVEGRESVTVPAGTFKAWKVRVTSVDGGAEQLTFWYDTRTRRYLKSTAVLAQMGGAVLTAELQNE